MDMPPAVARKKGQLETSKGSAQNLVGWIAPWRFNIPPFRVLEAVDVVDSASPDDGNVWLHD